MRCPPVVPVIALIASQTFAARAMISLPPGQKAIAVCKSDLDVNHVPETIVITCRAADGGHPVGGEVVVLQPSKSGALNIVWRHRNLNPWKLMVWDVDGDGKREIVLGVWKKSPRDPVMAKRTFVYSWTGSRMAPKWLGSRLSRRFDDFTVADIDRDKRPELLSLEIMPGGRHRVAAYRWRSFGFEWLGCSASHRGLRAFCSVDGRPAVQTTDGRRLRFELLKGSVIFGKRGE